MGLKKDNRKTKGERQFRVIIREEGCAHITGKSFIVLHQLLVLLVDCQHFADPVGCRLSLDGEGRESLRPQIYTLMPSRWQIFSWKFNITN